MRASGTADPRDVYEPRPEVARGHLAVALTTLLIHPPTQGRKAGDEFATYICDPLFVPAAAHIQATFFDRVRSAARRQVVMFAAKHALLELDPGGRLPAAEHADRMAVALSAFANRDRALVGTAVEQHGERFQRSTGTPSSGLWSGSGRRLLLEHRRLALGWPSRRNAR